MINRLYKSVAIYQCKCVFYRIYKSDKMCTIECYTMGLQVCVIPGTKVFLSVTMCVQEWVIQFIQE